MKKRVVAGLVIAAGWFAAAPAQAGPQQGVKCPSGYDARISEGNRKLVCSRQKTYELASICSPAAFSSKGVKIGTNIVMDPAGIDQCLAVGTGAKTASVMAPPQPGYPAASAFRRDPSAGGPDRFVATVTEYAFPSGGPLYIGTASAGVRCPSGYDGDKEYDGRGIRCDKRDGPPRPADCDGIAAGPVALGWRWERDHRGAEDRCLPMGTGEDGPTKPEGMTKAQHDLERASDSIGWVLDKNSGARDRWQRKVYAFPASQ